jgi:hypothetical protein
MFLGAANPRFLYRFRNWTMALECNLELNGRNFRELARLADYYQCP